MEPMELDEDSSSHTPPPPAFPPRLADRLTYPGSHSVPAYSPLLTHPASGTLSGFSPARTLLSSTPQHSAASPYRGERSPFCRSATFHGWQDSSFASPAPPQRSFSREASLPRAVVGGVERREVMTSPGDSLTSMETSDQSDVSEMEVVHNSPSPSWDRVRSVLSSFSLFKQETESEQCSVTGSVPVGVVGGPLEEEGLKATEGIRTSWEPTLSTVQAAATVKHRKGRKWSPSKSETQLQEPAVAETQEERNRLVTRGQGEATPAVSAAGKSRCCYCGVCAAVLSVLVCLTVVVCVLFLQRHVSAQRENFTRVDTELLRNEMASKVFGQHIAVDVVPRTIEQYLRAVQDRKKLAENPNACFLPPLVLSFHGWTGVGKNFVSDIITGVFPARTVVKLLVPYHFPHQHLDELYQNQVQRWIMSNVTDYSVNFFILDEMDKASVGVTRGIHSAIAKLHERNSCRSPVVFLLLSNSFGTDINKQVFEAMMNKEQRGHLSLSHFSLLFDGSADHDEAWYKRLQSDVTVAVPFLPLEKQHVIQCIRQDLVTKKLSTQADLVRRVLQELQFTRLPSGQEFSQTGCKRVSDKVNLVAFE